MVGRVVNGQTRRAAVAGAVAAGRICGWWAPWGPDSAHRGLTVPAGSSSTSPVSADHRRPVLTAAYSTVLCTSPAAYCRKPPSTWGNTTGAGLHNIYYRTTAYPASASGEGVGGRDLGRGPMAPLLSGERPDFVNLGSAPR